MGKKRKCNKANTRRHKRQISQIELAKQYLLYWYYYLFLHTCCAHDTTEYEMKIQDLVAFIGEGAERVTIEADRKWAKQAPTLSRIFWRGTDEEKRVVNDVQIDRHDATECELCKARAARTDEVRAIDRDIIKLEARVKAALDKSPSEALLLA